MTAKKQGKGASTHQHGKGAVKRKYGKGAQKEVEKVMHEYKRGKAKSGPARKTVTSRKQAVAIGLSKARQKGIKVPKKAAK